MISEGSSDTENWVMSAENSASLSQEKNYILKHMNGKQLFAVFLIK